jgi:hypothetical protein
MIENQLGLECAVVSLGGYGSVGTDQVAGTVVQVLSVIRNILR